MTAPLDVLRAPCKSAARMAILSALCAADGRVVDHDTLAFSAPTRRLGDVVSQGTLKVHIHRLRREIKRQYVIQCVHGLGYCLRRVSA